MATMHPHDYQHDNSREADEVLDEFRALFRRARRSASDTLRAHRDRQARLDRAARERGLTGRDIRAAEAATEAHAPRSEHKQRVDVPGPSGGISPDLIARWAAAHAAADLFREQAAAAHAADAAAERTEETAKADRDADVAEAWAQAWDEQVRAAGVDPAELAEQHTGTAGADDVADQSYADELAEWSGELAVTTADAVQTASSASPPVGHLIAAANTPSADASEAGRTASPSLSAVPALGADTAVELDAGAQL